MTSCEITVAEYLLIRLKQIGVDHLFGVPGGAALDKAASADSWVFIEIHTGRLDYPEALRSAGRSMTKINQLG